MLVLAKAPRPGRVKTRLCSPCSPEQAAAVAAAALADTLDAVTATPAVRRTILLDGRYPAPHGWRLVDHCGGGLGERLAAAYADTALPDTGSLLVGMDTPQVTPELLTGLAAGLDGADAVLGPALDGGWWGLALRDPADAEVLRAVPMSTPDTARSTVDGLRERGLSVALGPPLRDVDTAVDAWAVAAARPEGRFAPAVRTHVPAPHGTMVRDGR